jgi:hypothetical protein
MKVNFCCTVCGEPVTITQLIIESKDNIDINLEVAHHACYTSDQSDTFDMVDNKEDDLLHKSDA